MGQHQDHLDETCDPCGGVRVPDVRRGRPDPKTDPAPLGGRAEPRRRGGRFDLVAERDSGAVISR